MITRMTKYSFILLNGEKTEFLQKLQDFGIVDITRSSKPVDEFSQQLLNHIDDVKAEISNITTGSDALLVNLLAKRAELDLELKNVMPWGDYDIKRLASFGVRFYCVLKKKYQKEREDRWAIQIVSEDQGYVWFVVVGDSEGFPVKDIPAPERTAKEIEEEIAQKDEEIRHHRRILENEKSELPNLEQNISDMTADLNVYLAGVSGETAAEDYLVVLQGFAPSKDDKRLQAAFDDMDIYYVAEAAKTQDNPPIELNNNKFSKQFEVITSMYGMPVYNEFDPTIFLSIFFLLFFSMCMGDAGYGLVLIGIGLFVKGKNNGLSKIWSLIVTLGAGTFFVGLLMGGSFGGALSVQRWVPAWMKKFMITGNITIGGGTYAKQMILALLIGVVHICLALTLKAVWAIKKDGLKYSLGTLGWTILIVGSVIGLAIWLTGIISEEQMKWLLIGIASISELGIYFFNKWGRNPLLNFGSGLWDTYSMASGIVGDTLSYIRLYALGLSGGMLGSTFNQIAGMIKGPDPTWQWVPVVLVLLVGHVLNIAMSCLGAFVHPLRLNFVEFFKNSGYEGSGATYRPLVK